MIFNDKEYLTKEELEQDEVFKTLLIEEKGILLSMFE